MITELFFLGRDNENVLEITADGKPLDFSGVTRMVMKFRGSQTVVDSALNPEMIEWDSQGRVMLRLGELQIIPSKYRATLIAYDPAHDDGQVIFHYEEEKVICWFIRQE